MNSHMIKRKIYKEIKKEIINMNNSIACNLNDTSNNNFYSKHALYKSRKRNIYR